MRRHGIVGVYKAAKVRTTIPAEDAPRPDLIGRRFDPGKPMWPGWATFTYVAPAKADSTSPRCSICRLLGYSMAEHMRTELLADALTMAAGARGGATEGIIFHGDRGSPVSTSGASIAASSPISAWSSGWPHRGVLGQRRSGGLLVLAQARAGAAPPVLRSGQSPAGDLRLDQPLQPAAAALKPRLCPTHRVGEQLPSTPGRAGRVTNVTGQRRDPQCPYRRLRSARRRTA